MRLLVLVVLSVALMVVDARFTLLKPVRSQMSLVLMQSYWITDLPQRLWPVSYTHLTLPTIYFV